MIVIHAKILWCSSCVIFVSQKVSNSPEMDCFSREKARNVHSKKKKNHGLSWGNCLENDDSSNYFQELEKFSQLTSLLCILCRLTRSPSRNFQLASFSPTCSKIFHLIVFDTIIISNFCTFLCQICFFIQNKKRCT